MLQREGRMSIGSYVLRKLAQVQLRDELDPAARVRQAAVERRALPTCRCCSPCSRTMVIRTIVAARRAYEIGVHHLFPRERPGYAAPENWAGQLDRCAQPSRPARAAREGATDRGDGENHHARCSSSRSERRSCCERSARRCIARCRRLVRREAEDRGAEAGGQNDHRRFARPACMPRVETDSS